MAEGDESGQLEASQGLLFLSVGVVRSVFVRSGRPWSSTLYFFIAACDEASDLVRCLEKKKQHQASQSLALSF